MTLKFRSKEASGALPKSSLPNIVSELLYALEGFVSAVESPSLKLTFGPVGCDPGAGGGTGRRAGFRCRCLRTCGFESHPAHHSPSTGYPVSRSIPHQTSHSPMWRVTETRHLQQLHRSRIRFPLLLLGATKEQCEFRVQRTGR